MGKFHTHKVELFLKGTTFPVEEDGRDIHPENGVRARVEIVQAAKNSGTFAEAGGSGSPILSPTLGGRNFVFCGMVIGASGWFLLFHSLGFLIKYMPLLEWNGNWIFDVSSLPTNCFSSFALLYFTM